MLCYGNRTFSYVIYPYPVCFLHSVSFSYIQRVRGAPLFNDAHIVLYWRHDDGCVLVAGVLPGIFHGNVVEHLHGGVLPE